MGVTVTLTILLTATSFGSAIPARDVQHQNQVFQRYWGTEFVWEFDALPASGSVATHQTPYAGYIYPDNSGGTIHAMRKYDHAFHRGQTLATAWEDKDTKAWKAPVERRGPFSFVPGRRMAVPSWSGHCNGWAAAAIRHAEPQKSVRVNDVVFTPSDIKALLAELYIYNDVVDLSGSGQNISAGIFHVVLANWLGRGGHGLGMEADPGEEKWNYPVYAYNSDSAKRSGGRQVEVKLNLAYVKDVNREYDKGPRNFRLKHFHYILTLDAQGRIVGGRFLPSSSLIAMLWLPLQAKEARQPGNMLGNPYLSAKRVMAIWRASVPEEERQKWVVVDPTQEDRYVDLAHVDTLIPLGYIGRQSASPIEMAVTDQERQFAPRMAVKPPPPAAQPLPPVVDRPVERWQDDAPVSNDSAIVSEEPLTELEEPSTPRDELSARDMTPEELEDMQGEWAALRAAWEELQAEWTEAEAEWVEPPQDGELASVADDDAA